MADDARLSKLLFEAREVADMFADMVQSTMHMPSNYLRNLVKEIDAYRAERGWSPHGFGGEDG